MYMAEENILVEEMPSKDYSVNGIKVVHDEDDTFMFVKLISVNPKDLNKLESLGYSNSDVLVIKRIAKIPFVGEKYIVSTKDILGGMTIDEYENL